MNRDNKIEVDTIKGKCTICGAETDWIQFVSDVNKKPKYVGWFYMCKKHEYKELKEYVYKNMV